MICRLKKSGKFRGQYNEITQQYMTDQDNESYALILCIALSLSVEYQISV